MGGAALAALVQKATPDHAAHKQEPCDGPPGFVHLRCSCGVELSIADPVHATAYEAMRLVVEKLPTLPEDAIPEDDDGS
jgi:hypothetical protein